MKINYGSSKGLGEIVLSFDDGPHPINTPKLLNLLKRKISKPYFLLWDKILNLVKILI